MADLDELVNIPNLLFTGGLVASPQAGRAALSHGRVFVENWSIGSTIADLPRWVLRGVTIRCGDKEMEISECGMKIIRRQRVLM